MDIIRDRTEVKPGDFILPVSDMGYDNMFYPQRDGHTFLKD